LSQGRHSADSARSPVTAGPRPRPAHDALAVPSPHDALLAWGDQGSLLLDPADPRHPFHFDHRTDHVPGMVLLEAARQGAAVRSGGRLLRPVACRLKALDFTEFTPHARVECVPDVATCAFRFHQDGRQTAVGVLRYP
jgi:2-oxo-3-(phosphooxy)propyl 3-oxoalkanoate synthase